VPLVTKYGNRVFIRFREEFGEGRKQWGATEQYDVIDNTELQIITP
jgi:hypothetical protein